MFDERAGTSLKTFAKIQLAVNMIFNLVISIIIAKGVRSSRSFLGAAISRDHAGPYSFGLGLLLFCILTLSCLVIALALCSLGEICENSASVNDKIYRLSDTAESIDKKVN